MNTWENPMRKEIDILRNKECKYTKYLVFFFFFLYDVIIHKNYMFVISFLLTSISYIISILSVVILRSLFFLLLLLFVYRYVKGLSLDPTFIFPALAVLKELKKVYLFTFILINFF
jgi:hypothetical protein